jgi:hypothetical protein
VYYTDSATIIVCSCDVSSYQKRGSDDRALAGVNRVVGQGADIKLERCAKSRNDSQLEEQIIADRCHSETLMNREG